MSLRNLFLQIHLYLGLATGLVIAVVCFTGAVLAFEDEIEEALHPERYFVEPAAARLPLDEVVARIQAERPDLVISSVTVHDDPRRSLELSTGRGGPRAFADPYTGALLGTYVYNETFFYTMFALHRWLLAGDTGKLIVGVCTLLFLVILVSGVFVWWPKNRRQLQTRTKVTRTLGWKRFNFDLHVSLGIYAAVFLFIMAFTGLAWSFQWFNDGIYWVTRSPQTRTEPPQSAFQPNTAPVSLEAAYQTASATLGPADYYSLSLPHDSAAALSVRALPEDAAHERATTSLYLDQYSGDVLGVERFADRSLGARVRTTFYPLHVGSIYGWPTRILAFLACVLGATFPITGILIWINKRSKRWRRWWRERRQPAEREVPVES